MKYLLDTHIYLWWLGNSKKLKASIRQEIANPQNKIFVSLVSAWEIGIKYKIGKLALKTTLVECLKHYQDFNVLPITLEDIIYLDKLPLLHKDPFDRLLIAQVQVEKMKILTADPIFSKYQVAIFKD